MFEQLRSWGNEQPDRSICTSLHYCSSISVFTLGLQKMWVSILFS